MSSIQSKILALKVGETVRIESETFGKVQFQVEGTVDNREPVSYTHLTLPTKA